MQLAAIGDIAEVRPGLSTGGRLQHDSAGTHQVVMSRHLALGQPYRFSSGDEFRIIPGRDARKYEVRAGDVLFMSRGMRNVASWLELVPDPSIAPVSFYILRPSEAVDSGYLAWFLNQPSAQRAIADIRTGAGTPIVQRAPFTMLRLPLPDLETQRIIAGIGSAMAHERLLLEQFAAATGRLHDMTNERIAHELLARAEIKNVK